MDYAKSISKNLNEIKARIVDAALRGGRSPEDVQLVAVTKTFPVQAILAAYNEGHRNFGENRPEQGTTKIPEVANALQGKLPTWHMIGHIQSRKARLVIEHFDFVHSLDSIKLAQKLSTQAISAGKELPVLLECNVSGETSKYGYQLAGWEQDLTLRAAFFDEVESLIALPNLAIQGLMTMAPIADDADEVRPVFVSLRALRDALRERFPQLAWPHLSMGMTDDFEVAIEEGATFVRIGRAIFGAYQR
jgi:pyridoxal phosphate enzyme (YggS family)